MIESASGSRSGGLIRVIKKITHTQLLTIATTPFVIVPATETPNYGSNLTKVPVIVNGFIQGNNFAVNYSNVDDNGFGQIWLGSDLGSNIVSTQIHKSTFLSGDAGSVFTNRFLINSSDINNNSDLHSPPSAFFGNYYDNALVLKFDNKSAGNFTGGAASNFLKLFLWYVVADTSDITD